MQKIYEARDSKTLRARFVVHPMGYPPVKKNLFFNALVPRYTIHIVDDFEKLRKMEFFSKIFFLTLGNIDLDDVLCDLYRTKGPLVDYISFKNFKRIREERQGQKQKHPKKAPKKSKL